MPLIQMMRAMVILKMSTMPFFRLLRIYICQRASSGPVPESHHIYQPVSQPATMQRAGQVPYVDQSDAHEQSLGQSDGSLPGPEQSLNQSVNNQDEHSQTSCTCCAEQRTSTLPLQNKPAMKQVHKYLIVRLPGEISLDSTTGMSVIHLIMSDLSCDTYEVN